ncbi:MAG: GxxExxY protein [Planctomycetaceae bacterium]
MLEDMYEEALCYELELRGVPAARQIEVPVIYEGRQLAKLYKLDVLVDRKVIVEVKATEQHHPVFCAQCRTHLILTGKRLGLVINFGERYLKDGIPRVVNGLAE